MSIYQTPPQTETELLANATRIAGYTLGELALQLRQTIPEKMLHAKGWGGQLLELYLGATAGSLAEPDFQHLGIELKTVPIDVQGRPLESTYISVTPLLHFTHLTWENSDVYKKLQRILWIPLISQKKAPVAERIIGQPFLWSPTLEQAHILKQDWQELMDKVAMGQLQEITAKQGVYLQIRPKAANNKSLCFGIDAEGNRIQTLPRGFYLRANFTRMILQDVFTLE